jgi:hypothetical protein
LRSPRRKQAARFGWWVSSSGSRRAGRVAEAGSPRRLGTHSLPGARQRNPPACRNIVPPTDNRGSPRRSHSRLADVDPAGKQKQIEAILGNFTRYLTVLIQEARTAEEAAN